ncbi:MAG: E2 domain-containing protein, partial [Mesorhizobium sp.]
MAEVEPIDLLRRTTPDWFNQTKDSSRAIEGHAVVAVANGVGRTVADLRITDRSGKVTVSETVVGMAFPARCSERHIEWDGSFCIGYRAGLGIRTVDEAVVWWGLLEQFLRLQRVASRTRRWPARQAIAHGEAGPHHLRALEAARELGLEEDYFQMLEGEPKWFA